MFRYSHLILLLCLCQACGVGRAEPTWVVTPGDPGPDLPPQGRSLFDHVTSDDGRQVVPFPYEALLASLRSKLSDDAAYLGQPLKQVLIPLGRSLQREAAAPHFFESPRVVMAVDAEPATTLTNAGILLRDRIFIGYLEAADVLEIISYNESAARFEFQVVTNYRRDADPKVMYARRLVCTACHQNSAPIFARPLWDETNNNADISGQLKNIHSDYHGIPIRLGIDIAYAIDNSTDRANEFSLTQKLWQEGCGNGTAGAICRAALLTRTLQYAFTGGRGFDDVSEDYQESLRQPMFAVRQRLWPEGFFIPNPDIPNRRPLAGYRLPTPNGQGNIHAALTKRSNVTAAFEPLAPRSPQSTWNPDPDAWVDRAVSGLAQFLTADDVRRIDAHLARTPAVKESTHTADCTVTRAPGAAAERIKLDCPGDAFSFTGLLYTDRPGGTLSGRLSNFRLDNEDMGSLAMTGHQSTDGQLQIEMKRVGSPYRLRRANGDGLTRLSLRWQDPDHTKAIAELIVRHDAQTLVEAIRKLAANPDSSLARGPFRRADSMRELFESLGLERLTWCCTQHLTLPPASVEPSTSPPDSPRLSAFLKACAGCHRSSAPFPPNFLAGGTDRMLRAIAHCGERIQYRLAMWDLAPNNRAKTPMPPLHSAGPHKNGERHWISGLLPQLRQALHEIAVSESRPLPADRETVARPYTDLRPCLPLS